MEKLLNVVNNTVFEVSQITSKQANPRDRFVDGCFMTGTDGLDDVTHQKPPYAIGLNIGNRALRLQTSSGRLAGGAIRDTVANEDVATAEDLMAYDAETTPVCECEEISALGTQNVTIALPQG